MSNSMDEYYRQLVGGKIYDFSLEEDDDDTWPVLWVEHPEYGFLKIEVSCDPEGNGSGFLFISEDDTPVLETRKKRKA